MINTDFITIFLCFIILLTLCYLSGHALMVDSYKLISHPNILFCIILIVSNAFCQDDGGMLCWAEDVVPIWILRYEIIDQDSHTPVSYANIEISDGGRVVHTWSANRNGVAVLVITDPNCLPYEGTVEITARNYRYVINNIEWITINNESK